MFILFCYIYIYIYILFIHVYIYIYTRFIDCSYCFYHLRMYIYIYRHILLLYIHIYYYFIYIRIYHDVCLFIWGCSNMSNNHFAGAHMYTAVNVDSHGNNHLYGLCRLKNTVRANPKLKTRNPHIFNLFCWFSWRYSLLRIFVISGALGRGGRT